MYSPSRAARAPAASAAAPCAATTPSRLRAPLAHRSMRMLGSPAAVPVSARSLCTPSNVPSLWPQAWMEPSARLSNQRLFAPFSSFHARRDCSRAAAQCSRMRLPPSTHHVSTGSPQHCMPGPQAHVAQCSTQSLMCIHAAHHSTASQHTHNSTAAAQVEGPGFRLGP